MISHPMLEYDLSLLFNGLYVAGDVINVMNSSPVATKTSPGNHTAGYLSFCFI